MLTKVTDVTTMNTEYKRERAHLSLGIRQPTREIKQLGQSTLNYLKVMPWAETNLKCIKKFEFLEVKEKELEKIYEIANV